ncbi:MAG: Crp/Fnr family transcriptional regulator [Arcicella sp.]|nr:Crp/Fnr family transcriptional regulator [Arcicella sp.]
MNHYYEKLFEYVGEILIMPEEAKEACRQTFKPIFVPRDTIIEPAGTVPQYHNFIVSGYMRNFHLDDEGNEITTDINNSSRFFTSYQHFMNQTVSNENMHCITDCELLRINREDVGSPDTQSQAQKDYTIKLFQNLLSEEKQRIYDLANLTAEQRYQKFVKLNPNIIYNVPYYTKAFESLKRRTLIKLCDRSY